MKVEGELFKASILLDLIEHNKLTINKFCKLKREDKIPYFRTMERMWLLEKQRRVQEELENFYKTGVD